MEVTENAKPIFFQPRQIPLALKSKVEDELNRLIELNIIEPVEYSEWGTTIVPLIKKDMTIRICGDFKITLNKFLKIDRQPLPRFEDVAEILAGSNIFAKLDLSEAYQQIPLSKESQKYVVISTHKDLFKYKVLCYGVSTGPGTFQRILASLLGISGVVVFLYLNIS